jgi:hypothetical protein
MTRIVGLIIGGYLAMLVVVSVIALTVRTLEAWTGHSVNELGRPLGWLALILVVLAGIAYFVLATVGIFGGMWITRHQKERNHYGVDTPEFPMKHPKI